MTLILGIETSCDETAAAVVEDGRTVRSNVVASQIALHQQYGGVFPEMASRQHMLTITPVIRQALGEAHATWRDLAAIAVIHGPGLAGSLLVGLNVAKALAWAQDIPLVGVNHLEAHIYANWLIPPSERAAKPSTTPPFPLVCAIVSGGHTDLVLMREHHDYQLLGQTIDDAAGEAFDKVARLLGLGYPGGPAIQRAAEGADAPQPGNPSAYNLPRSLGAGSGDFSFSGLKTAVLRLVQEIQRRQGSTAPIRGRKMAEVSASEGVSPQELADIAASFQMAVVDALLQRTAEAVERYGAVQVLLAGGVAANKLLRAEMSRRIKVVVRYPPINYCTDNAAMVAAAGYFRFLAGLRSGLELDIVPGLRMV